MASWKKVIVSGSQASQLSFAGTGILSGSGAITAVTDTATIDLTFAAGSLSGFVRSGSIDQGQLASNSVIAAKIANNAVTTAKILNANVTNEKLANSAITIGSTSTALGATSTTLAGLTSVTSTTFVGALTGNASTATSASYANLTNVSGDVTITAAGVATIANNAVTTAKILNANVTNEKLANSAITIAGTSTSLGGSITKATILSTTNVVSSSAEGDGQGQIKLNGVNVNTNNLGTNDSPTFTNLTLSGNLFVNGTTTTINTDNLNIEDKFILLNSGSKTSPANEGGIIVESGSAVGTGTAFYFDGSDNRWSLKDSLSATNTAAVTSNAFMSSVVTDDTNVRYRKVGNIRISGEDIFIYS
jgi:hypothetical protein